jgi:hypothetical protein
MEQAASHRRAVERHHGTRYFFNLLAIYTRRRRELPLLGGFEIEKAAPMLALPSFTVKYGFGF